MPWNVLAVILAVVVLPLIFAITQFKDDCTHRDWLPWSKCDCQSGLRIQERYQPLENNGSVTCPPLIRTESCQNTSCDTDCWSNWSSCSQSCGFGQAYRLRTVRNSNSKTAPGARCQQHPAQETKSCFETECHSDILCSTRVDGNYKDPIRNCSSAYISCTNRRQIVRRCPMRTVFDPAKRICNYPVSVEECHARTRNEANSASKFSKYIHWLITSSIVYSIYCHCSVVY